MKKSLLSAALLAATISPAYATPCTDADAGVACGTNAVAGHESNVAIGNFAELLPVTVNGATLTPTNATAVGAFAQAVAGSSAFGTNAQALGVNGVAFGRSAKAAGNEATAFGTNAQALGDGAIAVGYMAETTGGNGMALGRNARSGSGIAIGWNADSADGAVALGFSARTTGFGSLAIGNQAEATTGYAASFGHGARAQADSAVALGALATATGAGSVALGAGSEASEYGVVSFGRVGSTRRLVNLSAGVADTDGVNVSQLKAIAPALGGGSTIINGVFVNPIYNLSGGTFVNVGDALTYLDNRITNVAATPGPQGPQGPQGPNGQDGASGGSGCGEAVCYDDASRSSVTLNSGGGTTRVSNVRAGVASTDAVNVGQLEAGVTRAVNTSNAYTDQRISELRGDVWRVDRNARGGIASALAVAGLPQAYAPGARMAAVAASGYRGEAGLAVGISGVTDNGRWVYKLAGSSNTAGDFGMAVGAGIQW